MDRIVSQLLTEIDGLDKFSSSSSNATTANKSSQIFLIGATNRPDLIDSSLLRPGRFDKLIYVPIAKTFNERLNIFKALVRKYIFEILNYLYFKIKTSFKSLVRYYMNF